jgi:methyl-accepting chemotaxis protein
MTATKEVREAVGSIQSGVDNAQGSVVQAVESISGARELVESTGGFFDALNDLIASSAGQSSEIAASVQEQNAAGEEIRRLMADTSRIAQTTAEGMNISGRSLNELTQLSAKLRQLITQLGSAVPTQRPGENEPADEDALDDA